MTGRQGRRWGSLERIWGNKIGLSACESEGGWEVSWCSVLLFEAGEWQLEHGKEASWREMYAWRENSWVDLWKAILLWLPLHWPGHQQELLVTGPSGAAIPQLAQLVSVLTLLLETLGKIFLKPTILKPYFQQLQSYLIFAVIQMAEDGGGGEEMFSVVNFWETPAGLQINIEWEVGGGLDVAVSLWAANCWSWGMDPKNLGVHWKFSMIMGKK